MTLQPITITEEVVVHGEVVTQTRETLQWVEDLHEDAQRNVAMSVLHPDFVAAEDRVYTYNEETGMSHSARRVDEPEATFPEDSTESATATCGAAVGNGTCQLEAGHSGSHKLYV